MTINSGGDAFRCVLEVFFAAASSGGGRRRGDHFGALIRLYLQWTGLGIPQARHRCKTITAMIADSGAHRPVLLKLCGEAVMPWQCLYGEDALRSGKRQTVEHTPPVVLGRTIYRGAGEGRQVFNRRESIGTTNAEQ